MGGYGHVLMEPCTKAYEHHPHAFLIMPLHNLGRTEITSCPGWRVPAQSVSLREPETGEREAGA